MGDDKLESLLAKIDEEFRFYRQLALGVSATLLALCGILFKIVLDKLTFPTAHGCMTTLWFFSLTVAGIGGIFIQVCNYMGYKHMARRYFPRKGMAAAVWSEKRWESGNRWFSAGDWSLWISVSGLILGFISTVYLRRVL